MQIINERDMEWTQVSENLKIKYLLKDYLVNSDVISSGVANWPYGKAGEPHIHSEHDEFYIVLRGRGRAHIMGELLELGPGDMMHAKAGETHGMVEGLTEDGIDLFFALIPKAKENPVEGGDL